MPTEQATDNSGSGPVEVNYLTIDPASVSDAIDLDALPPGSLREMDPKQRKWFWGFIGGYAIVFTAAIITRNSALQFLAVGAMFFLIWAGVKFRQQNRKIGGQFLGAVLGVSALMLSVVYLTEQKHRSAAPEASPSTQSSSSESRYVLDASSASACESYLKGKTFRGGSARLEFGFDGTVSAYDSNGGLVFGGTLEIGSAKGEMSRWIYVRDMGGAGKLQFLLSADGKMMEPSSFVMYSPD